MPPRKRAAAKPAAAENTSSEAADQQALPAEVQAPQQPPADEEVTDQPDSGPAGDDQPAAPGDTGPERGDLQAVDTPCEECFPGGWPEQSFAVGCEHGTWAREGTV